MNSARPPLVQILRGFFPGAQHPQFNNVNFYDIGGDFNNNASRADYLKPFIAPGAIHDAFQRSAPRCHPGTRKEPLQTIGDWINDEKSPKRLLWLYGPAGAGKSAIAQTIAESRAKDKLAASFFFLRNDSECGVADRLFPTLAWQLAKAIPETRSYIESALMAEPLLPTKSIDIQFGELFVNVFEQLLRDRPDFCSKKSLVVIDGIDECAGEQAQKDILGLIGNALARHNIPLFFLICSRSEPHIREAFDLETMRSVVQEIELRDASADIRRYLKEEFYRIFTKQGLPHPSDEEIDQLVSKSSGQFIFPSTVVKFIDDEDHNPRDQLDIVLGIHSSKSSSSPFFSLDQLYTQILSRQPDIRLLRDVFVLVIAFGRPNIDFICRRLHIKQDDLRRDLRRMHSLLHLSDDIIEIYHLSLHDFFQDERRAGKYYINPWRVMLLRLPNNAQWLGKKIKKVAIVTGWLLGASLLAPFFCPFLVVASACSERDENTRLCDKILLTCACACFCCTFCIPCILAGGDDE